MEYKYILSNFKNYALWKGMLRRYGGTIVWYGTMGTVGRYSGYGGCGGCGIVGMVGPVAWEPTTVCLAHDAAYLSQAPSL